MAIKLVVYDLDGTLADTAPVAVSLLNNLREQRGLSKKPIKFFKNWLSLGGSELVLNGLELSLDEDVNEWTKKFRELYRQQQGNASPLYDYVTESLSDLFSKNIRLAICTNKPRFLAEPILKAHNIDKFFSIMIAGGDLKSKKPSPENLLACLTTEKIHEVLYVGDSYVDQETAKNTKIKFVFFSKGYDDGVVQSFVDFKSDNHKKIKEYIIKNA